MKWLGSIAAFFLPSVLVLTVFAYVLDGTLLRADYIKESARQSQAYEGLAEELPPILARNGNHDQQLLIAGIMTAPYIQGKVESFLDQLEDHYRNDGPRPRLDFSDMEALARKQGQTLPPELGEAEPFVLGDGAVARQVFEVTRIAKLAGPLAAILLLALLAVAIRGTGRWMLLGRVALVTALLLALLYGSLLTAPELIGSFLSNNGETVGIAPVAGDFTQELAAGMYRPVGIAAIVAAAGAISAGVAALVVKVKHHFGGRKKPAH